MKLSKIEIENFRCIKKEKIDFVDYNCFIGPNNSGKSTVLNVLNIFFGNDDAIGVNSKVLIKEDFYLKDVSKPVKCTFHFEKLSSSAQEDFKDYYRNNKLIVSFEATWNEDSGNAPIRKFGERMVMDDFRIYFDKKKERSSVSELKIIYDSIKEKYSDLENVSTGKAMEEALRSYEESHPELLKPYPSEDLFYGASKGSGLFDKHLKWVYIPAVKEASSEQDESRNSAIGQLLEFTLRKKISFVEELESIKSEIVEKYLKVLDEKESSLESISKSLENRLSEWTDEDAKLSLKWHYDQNRAINISEPFARASLGNKDFMSEIFRSGHGLQRSFLISLLQELAVNESEDETKLILGIEEPELYQHPPKSRFLHSSLEELSKNDTQVILTTHSPYFTPSGTFTGLKRFSNAENRIRSTSDEEISSNLAKALGEDEYNVDDTLARMEQIMSPSLKDIYFTNFPILVEGTEDVAYLTSALIHYDQYDNFIKRGCGFIIGLGKNQMSRPYAVMKALGIPCFLIFDSDGNCKKGDKERNDKDNQCLISLSGSKNIDDITKKNIFNEDIISWETNIGREIKKEFGEEKWNQEIELTKEEFNIPHLGKKHPYLIANHMTRLYKTDWESDLLEKSVNKIIEYTDK